MITAFSALVPLDKRHVWICLLFLGFFCHAFKTQQPIKLQACVASKRENNHSGPPLTGLRGPVLEWQAGRGSCLTDAVLSVALQGTVPWLWWWCSAHPSVFLPWGSLLGCGFYGSNSIDLNVRKQGLPPEHLTEAWRSMSSTSRVTAFEHCLVFSANNVSIISLL